MGEPLFLDGQYSVPLSKQAQRTAGMPTEPLFLDGQYSVPFPKEQSHSRYDIGHPTGGYRPVQNKHSSGSAGYMEYSNQSQSSHPMGSKQTTPSHHSHGSAPVPIESYTSHNPIVSQKPFGPQLPNVQPSSSSHSSNNTYAVVEKSDADECTYWKKNCMMKTQRLKFAEEALNEERRQKEKSRAVVTELENVITQLQNKQYYRQQYGSYGTNQ